MDSGFLNSLVGEYLSSVSSKLAEKFKKETKATPLPPNSPSIAEMVQHYKETTPKVSKRKLAMTNGDSSAKKAKKDESSSDDSDSDDDNKNKKPVAKAAKAAAVEKMEEGSSDDSDSEDEKPAAKPKAAAPKAAKKVEKKESSSEDGSESEDEKPAAKVAAKAVPKAAAKEEESSSDDSDSEDEKPVAKKATPAAKPVPKAAAKKEESSSDDSDSDEDEKPAPKAKAATPAKTASKKEESSSDDSDSEDEEPAPKKPAPKKPTPAPKAASQKEESSDESDSEEEEPAPKKATPATKATAKKEESSDDSDSEDEEPATKKVTPAPKATAKEEESSSDSDSDSEDEKPAPKVKTAKKEESSDSDDSSSSDEEPAPKKAKAEPMDEDEPVMKVKSNKNKTLDDLKTPTKSHDQSYGGGDKSFSEEGRKIFIHNVSEEATYEDFQAAVEKHGEVTDFFNPGRGFGFITYSTNEEAQACIAAMDNTEIAGRTIQMNIARPKGEKPAPGTGGKRQEAAPGCKLFVHGITQETDNHSLKTAFEAHGVVTDAYNPGKGFAFVTYSNPSEANAAMAAFEGTEVCGCYVTINVAKDRKSDAGGRGGARGGRGGGGGGGRREEIEGAKLFVHNVSEDTEQQDLWNAFAEHGTVTDAYNPGRGFAFVTFASAEDAQKAMNALEGQEVCGREIQCNIAKPREAKNDGGGRGGRGGRGGARGGGRGGRGGRGGMSISVGGGGGNNKKISFD